MLEIVLQAQAAVPFRPMRIQAPVPVPSPAVPRTVSRRLKILQHQEPVVHLGTVNPPVAVVVVAVVAVAVVKAQ